MVKAINGGYAVFGPTGAQISRMYTSYEEAKAKELRIKAKADRHSHMYEKKAEFVFEKLSQENLLTKAPNFLKEYVAPSVVAGSLVGAGTLAVTSDSKADFKKNLGKATVAGIGGDIATAAALKLWHNRNAVKV